MGDPFADVIGLIYGRWRSQILYAGVKLGLFDVIGPNPAPAAEIAQKMGLDRALLYRLMRALGSLGLLKEDSGQLFSMTETGDLLRSDHPLSLNGLALLVEGPEHTAIWKHLPAIIQDGEQNGFIREYGSPAFEYAAIEPAYAAAFDAGMSGHSRMQARWFMDAVSSRDFSGIASLCDVGGGQGYLLSHILMKYPHLRGIVLERPSVIEDPRLLWAEKLGVAGRCQYIAGDMFRDVPIADAYIMKLILHDWNDEECAQILRVIQKRAPEDGRVFIVEHVVPGPNTPHFSKLFDIHMMVWGSGRERTTSEYTALLQAGGWQYVTTWVPTTGAILVIEGAKR